MDAAREDETKALLRAQDASIALAMAADAYALPLPEGADDGETRRLLRRVGALTVHCVGRVLPDTQGYHTQRAIYPVGYLATRIYWCVLGIVYTALSAWRD